MTKPDFLTLLARAYDFPDYFGHNLDAADECLADRLEALGTDRLPLRPLFDTLLADEPPEEREAVLSLLGRYFWVADDEEESPQRSAEDTQRSAEEEE
jgi:hypothetical protein